MPDYRHLQALCGDVSRHLEAAQAAATTLARDNRPRDAELYALNLLRGIVFARAELAVGSRRATEGVKA